MAKKIHQITAKLAQEMLDAGLSPLIYLDNGQLLGVPPQKVALGVAGIMTEVMQVSRMTACWATYLESVPCELQET